jgi:trans-2,3-dihydro-3-hydroxyanthranilate isomerase
MADRLYIVDVFAEQPFAGNQLAVIICKEFPASEIMQKIAAETNYSETTFVLEDPETEGGYRMRIFTPAREIEFTGHPLLGTAWVIREYLAGAMQEIQLNTPVGVVPVSFGTDDRGREVVWFQAPGMTMGEVAPLQPVANALGLAAEDIDPRMPLQVIAAGTAAIMVPVRGLDAIRRSMLNLDAFATLAAQGFPPLLYLISQETHDDENDLCVRFFFEAHGVREDPATGNGAAFLGRYLLEHKAYKDDAVSLRIEQGHEVRRPSLILLQAGMKNGQPDVRVGGYVVPTVSGTLCQ